MSLLIRARAKGAVHIWRHFTLTGGFNGHRIWRLYRWFGFDTLSVFCECGMQFGSAKDFTTTITKGNTP
jgi:hypothetical protein